MRCPPSNGDYSPGEHNILSFAQVVTTEQLGSAGEGDGSSRGSVTGDKQLVVWLLPRVHLKHTNSNLLWKLFKQKVSRSIRSCSISLRLTTVWTMQSICLTALMEHRNLKCDCHRVYPHFSLNSPSILRSPDLKLLKWDPHCFRTSYGSTFQALLVRSKKVLTYHGMERAKTLKTRFSYEPWHVFQ